MSVKVGRDDAKRTAGDGVSSDADRASGEDPQAGTEKSGTEKSGTEKVAGRQDTKAGKASPLSKHRTAGADSSDPIDRQDRVHRVRTFDAAAAVRRGRTILAQLVWLVCLLAAIVLAVGALLVVVKANTDNALVKAVMHLADIADVRVFDRSNGIKQFGGSDPAIKDALFNWGIGAVVWLVVGRILDRIIRPS